MNKTKKKSEGRPLKQIFQFLCRRYKLTGSIDGCQNLVPSCLSLLIWTKIFMSKNNVISVLRQQCRQVFHSKMKVQLFYFVQVSKFEFFYFIINKILRTFARKFSTR